MLVQNAEIIERNFAQKQLPSTKSRQFISICKHDSQQIQVHYSNMTARNIFKKDN